MNERERWIVYPLLFLALGAALRDKLVDRTTTKSIVCQELSIVDEDAANPQLQRTLVRIGRAKPKAGGKSTGYLQLNGDMELVDDDLSENSSARVLVKLGRTDPRPGVLSAGYAIVRGEMAIEGVLGARQYVWQGIPILPMQLVPGMAIPGMLQAVPPPGAKLPNQSMPKSQSPGQPAAAGAPKGQTVAPPSSPAGKESDSEK